MESIFVAIVTDDREYGRSLSLGILSVCRSFIIRIYSAKEFLSETREFDMVLWDGNEAKEAYGGRIVYLAEKPSEVLKSAALKRFCIYKYSAAASMVAALFEIYEALTGRRAVNLKRQEVRLLAFSSCEGGSGCTTAAMAAAQEFCRFQEKRVLYLSFEEYESTGDYMKPEEGVKGTAVYLYNLFNKIYSDEKTMRDEQRRPFLEGHMVRDDFGIEAFAPSVGRNPLRELKPDEMDRFMASLIDSNRYDVIIMDLGAWTSRTGLECIDMAEKICFITKEQEGTSREEQYISQVICHCGQDIMDKTISLINKGCVPRSAETDEKSTASSEDHMVLSRGKAFVGEGKRIRIALEGEFGREIGELCEKMVEPV